MIVSLLLILRNMLLTTIISPINFIEQFLIQHCNISVNGFSSVWKWGYPNFLRPATLNQRGHSIITFSQNDQNLDLPPLPLVCTCSILVTLLSAKVPPLFQQYHYPIVKSRYFIDSWTPFIISTYKCHKKYSHDMNVPSIIINTNGVYY